MTQNEKERNKVIEETTNIILRKNKIKNKIESCLKCEQKLASFKKTDREMHVQICQQLEGDVVKTLKYNSKIPTVKLENPDVSFGVIIGFERGYV